MITKSNITAGTDKTNEKRADLFKWLAVAGIWVAGIVGSYVIHAHLMVDQTAWYHGVLWIAVFALSGYVAFTTVPGAKLGSFFKDAQVELKKVVWPTRQETLQATLMVLVAVTVMSLLLWLIDSILFHLIGYISNIKL